MQNTLVVLLGPTAVGKTDISAELALHFGSEVISCDSRQFFSEMKIGTSVPSDEILRKVPHHFIRFISVKEYYSASLFERDVLKKLPEIFIRRNIAIMTGGSGMYINAVCDGIDDIPDVDPQVREKYNRKYLEEGIGGLRIALKLLDPDYYINADLRNHKRIIRALEICDSTGRPYSSFLNREKPERNFRIIKIGLERPRSELYSRINLRVDTMIEEGLAEEAKSLLPFRDLNALNTVGYRELFSYFDNKISFEKAIELTKRNTRRYAKRQMTWWAKDNKIKWFNAGDKDAIFSFLASELLD